MKEQSENWKAKAFELLPEMEDDISSSTSPMGLWIDIGFEFQMAYNWPRNEDFIRRVYEFSRWCVEQEPGKSAADDLATAVAISFWENLPRWPEARADMPRWFTRDEITASREIFSYLTSAAEFEELLSLFHGPTVSNRKLRRLEKSWSKVRSKAREK